MSLNLQTLASWGPHPPCFQSSSVAKSVSSNDSNACVLRNSEVNRLDIETLFSILRLKRETSEAMFRAMLALFAPVVFAARSSGGGG